MRPTSSFDIQSAKNSKTEKNFSSRGIVSPSRTRRRIRSIRIFEQRTNARVSGSSSSGLQAGKRDDRLLYPGDERLADGEILFRALLGRAPARPNAIERRLRALDILFPYGPPRQAELVRHFRRHRDSRADRVPGRLMSVGQRTSLSTTNESQRPINCVRGVLPASLWPRSATSASISSTSSGEN